MLRAYILSDHVDKLWVMIEWMSPQTGNQKIFATFLIQEKQLEEKHEELTSADFQFKKILDLLFYIRQFNWLIASE